MFHTSRFSGPVVVIVAVACGLLVSPGCRSPDSTEAERAAERSAEAEKHSARGHALIAARSRDEVIVHLERAVELQPDVRYLFDLAGVRTH